MKYAESKQSRWVVFTNSLQVVVIPYDASGLDHRKAWFYVPWVRTPTRWQTGCAYFSAMFCSVVYVCMLQAICVREQSKDYFNFLQYYFLFFCASARKEPMPVAVLVEAV